MLTWFKKVKKLFSRIFIEDSIDEQICKSLKETEKKIEKLPTERTILFLDVQKAVGEIKSSSEAVERVMHLMKMEGITIYSKIKIDAETWKAYILGTEIGSFLVTFKVNWLWKFSELFKRPSGESKEGTGLNLHLAKYCQLNVVKTLLIVKSDGTIHSIDIDELVDYATKNNTIRSEKESFEAHVPVSLLKPFKLKGKSDIIKELSICGTR